MKKVILSVFLIFLLVSCSPEPKPDIAILPNPVLLETKEAPTESPDAPSCALESTPQEVAFSAADGRELSGLFYPACAKGAPVVVLMHWVGGDKSDWYEIAAWLQNRGLTNPFQNPGNNEWWDASWFPKIDPSISYNVFIFSFRGCQPYNTGCQKRDEAGWLLDANAAMLKASDLEEVEPGRVAVIGSSIGADGAADSCLWLDEQKPDACKGALSLSPGSFLGKSYPGTAQKLGELAQPAAVWCLADEKEIAVCNSAANLNPTMKALLIPDGEHGNELLRPGLTPSPMESILDFLNTAFTE